MVWFLLCFATADASVATVFVLVATVLVFNCFFYFVMATDAAVVTVVGVPIYCSIFYDTFHNSVVYILVL